MKENEHYANECNELLKHTEDIVFLEGTTDALYFNKVKEVYNIKTDIVFRAIGHSCKNGDEEFMGQDNMKHIIKFLKETELKSLIFFLFDCDVKYKESDNENMVVKVMKKYENSAKISCGIENALVLDGIDIKQYYDIKLRPDGGNIEILNKHKLCDYICNIKDAERQKRIFANLKKVVDEIISRQKVQ